MVTDIHKGQHFIHQPFYTPTHQSKCLLLYRSIHQHLQTMSSLLCSSGAAMVMAHYNKNVYKKNFIRTSGQIRECYCCTIPKSNRYITNSPMLVVKQPNIRSSLIPNYFLVQFLWRGSCL